MESSEFPKIIKEPGTVLIPYNITESDGVYSYLIQVVDDLGQAIPDDDTIPTWLPDTLCGIVNRLAVSKQEEGFTCTNGIKLQCREIDLARLLQAKAIIEDAGLTEILIQDYNNTDHVVSADDFKVMRIELAFYVQSQILGKAWSQKKLITAATSRQAALQIVQW